MNGWKQWEGKKVFLRTKNDRVYSGVVVQIDDSDKYIIFLTLKDKFGLLVSTITNEIVEIKEET